MKDTQVCPCCGSKSTFFLYKSKDRMFQIAGNFGLWRCYPCGQVFLSPQLTEPELEKYYPSNQYYAYVKTKKKVFFEKLRDYLVRNYYHPTLLSRLLSMWLPKVPAIPARVENGKVLDLGCGTGDTLVLLKKIGWQVYGLDIDKKALAIAKKRGLANVRLGRFQNLRYFQNNFFNAIRLYHVIEHVNNPQLCFKLLHQKLKKGGELIIGTPNAKSLVAKLFGTFWYNLDSPRHLFLFTPETLKRLAIIAGFKVEKTEFCSAGGIVGSLQYWLNDNFKLKLDLIHKFGIILFFYPLEWFLDKLQIGDVFLLRLTK